MFYRMVWLVFLICGVLEFDFDYNFSIFQTSILVSGLFKRHVDGFLKNYYLNLFV